MARRTRPLNREIPMGPFSDIAFLLIIFFILVTSLTKNLGFATEIPAGEKSAAKQEQTTVVAIRDERIFLNDQGLKLAELRAQLTDLKLAERTAEDERLVMLESSGQVSYQAYYAVMAAISQAGGVIAIVREEE